MEQLDIVRDIRKQADEVRGIRPDVAARLDADSDALVENMAPLPVRSVAEYLGRSKPTVHDWVDRGILADCRVSGRLHVLPESLLEIAPAVQAWEAEGHPGRLLRFVRDWLKEERALDKQREAVAAARANGMIGTLAPGGGGILTPAIRERLERHPDLSRGEPQ